MKWKNTKAGSKNQRSQALLYTTPGVTVFPVDILKRLNRPYTTWNDMEWLLSYFILEYRFHTPHVLKAHTMNALEKSYDYDLTPISEDFYNIINDPDETLCVLKVISTVLPIWLTYIPK